ncbi:TPA: 30S ribosomal protein S4 [Candidatus Sumerlaeota bacterium]|nr:30S ribosomal protein S4 [Candidatus Sumerlaeota bacterium]
MNYTGPKVRLSRKLGVALTPKAERVMQKRSNPPGQHGGAQNNRKVSVYKRQLREKQLLRHFYNIQERQLRNYFRKASRFTGNTADTMLGLLESRLDAVVARSGIARTIFASRQNVVHGHILVNGKPVNIPSYHVKEGDVISVREKSRAQKNFIEALESAVNTPIYLELDKEKMSVMLISKPKREDIPVIKNADVSLVIEFYAR